MSMFKINEQRVKSPRFEVLESPIAISSVTVIAVETTISRPASKRKRTEVGSVEQHSDTLITYKQVFHIIEYLDKINSRQIKIERNVSDVQRMLEESKMYRRILDRLWTNLSKASEQIAFAVSLCEFFLNPKNEKNMKNSKAFSQGR
ncbi:hypothetical protein Glove_50g127 [Diversispora epigaea]|uniref:Uncharacterized protein n=1 Tax=Diversispora epigaea TaxID=1348612 RepID=A0A397JFW7_9GLOM|nr:hypothetical protein Glove_50g127 [Diversispora epigaea]